MSDIQRFTFPLTNQSVRITDQNGEPWWVAKDICDVLGLEDARKAVGRLDDDERNTIPVTDSIGREQNTYIINESGLYSLILTSRKPEAKAFKKWITSEVLPAIRKTGGYGVQQIASVTRAEFQAFQSDYAAKLKALEKTFVGIVAPEKKVVIQKGFRSTSDMCRAMEIKRAEFYRLMVSADMMVKSGRKHELTERGHKYAQETGCWTGKAHYWNPVVFLQIPPDYWLDKVEIVSELKQLRLWPETK